MPAFDLTDMKKFNAVILKLTKQLDAKKGKFLVWILADWCGHCQTFKNNEWHKITKDATKSKKYTAVAIEYDGVFKHLQQYHADHKLVQMVGKVQHFPYLVKFDLSTGKTEVYQGDNNATGVINFMK